MRKKMSLKYGNRVKVISGFYEGCIGFLIAYKEIGIKKFPRYEVIISNPICSVEVFSRWFKETSLEKIEEFEKINF